MRKLLDDSNGDLKAVLEGLIAEDVDITVQEIKRRHPLLKSVSSFTRNADRMKLITGAQQRQRDARQVKLAPITDGTLTVTEKLAKKTQTVEILEAQVRTLVAATAACIRAVQQRGGMPALERFWVDYKSIADSVRGLGAMPPGATVVDISSRREE